MTRPKLPVRVSPALREIIDQAGPVNAATRALILLGAAASELNLDAVADEMHALIGCQDLAPAVRAALQTLITACGGTPAPTVGVIHAPSRGGTGHTGRERQTQPRREVSAHTPIPRGADQPDPQGSERSAAPAGDWLLAGLGIDL